ncbi:glycosyltransferase 87 family protein [Nocardia sp. CDC160]|uniref:glycosyltransferase 87 family protein n=1 Tax=Nocardia sp. CDC160 TaxID=3112166 RepID=UPI002DBE07F5|nr:glycosyltransferase 87 family protein [Nocardia sp. CDC160]MEC3913588.1 glycosyltransferase 87 family protein [Nocardia sp. CDC160]
MTTARGLTTRQRQLLLVAVALFAVSAVISYLTKWHGYIDLRVYRNGARAWLDGKDLYGPMPAVYGIGLPFTYPPLAALFFAPLALMPLAVAEWAVLVVSVASLGVTLWLVLDRLRPSLAWPTRLALVIGAVALTQLLEPIRETYGFGQINLVLMAAVALDCLARRTFWPRGMLIGIAVSVKLTPGGYLLYFLLRKDWKGAITVVASTIGAVAVGWALFPHDSPQYWFHTLADTGRIGPPWYAGNQSIKGFVFRLGFSTSVATLLWLLLSAAAVALAAVWMKRLLDVDATVAALMVNAAAVLLVSPVSWSHHWVWIAPALLVAADAVARGRRNPWFLGAVGLAVAMFAVGPMWLLPHNADRELTWNWWQQLLGNSYVLFTFAVFVVAALTYRPTPTAPESAEA